MRDFQSILFATDFRSGADDALDATARLATAVRGEVTALHVLEPLSGAAAVHFYHHQISEQLMQNTSQAFAAQGVTLAGTQLPSGAVVDTIARASEGADLTIVGAGQRNERGEFVLGPNIEAIVSHATRSTLVIRPGEPRLGYQRILCAVDHSKSSALALRHAIRLAELFQGSVTVLSVIPDVSWLVAAVETGRVVDVQADHAKQWTQEFDEFLGQFDFAGVPWKRELGAGVTHDVILAKTASENADLLVLGSTGRSLVARILLGSTTRRILRRLPCSLLTVKEAAAG